MSNEEGELGEKMDSFYQSLIDESSDMFKAARESALKMFHVAEKYDEMAAMAREIATLHLIQAKVSGGALADLLEGQFSLQVEEEPVIDDEEDEDPDPTGV